jgi:DNA mismatch repair protein MutS
MDVERLHRKLGLNMFQPSDFGNLDLSYEYINTMLDYNSKQKTNNNSHNNNNNYSEAILSITPSDTDITNFKAFIQDYKTVFNMDEIVKFHLDKINSSFFNRGIVDEIDQIQDQIQNYRDILKYTAKRLSHILEDDSNQVKLEFNDRDGHYLAITAKRSMILKQKFNNMNNNKINVRGDDNTTILYKLDPKELHFKSMNKTAVRITSNLIKQTSNNLRLEQEKIKSLSTIHFQKKCLEFYNKYSDSLREISKFVGNMDLFKSNAKTAMLYGYHRPTIDTDLSNNDNINNNGSYLIAKQIRHPIIERIQTNLEYVTNDISLGVHNKNQETLENQETSKKNGMLLFGTNASGKSSLMKAIGINIIMAQSGMYVAASDFKFKPYTQLFTRINNNDNIFKGESSFAVEMSELRSILKRCDSKSLILGDELCSGTESVSAQSIFAASVIRLVAKNTNFIFATHLHELCRMEKIVNLENIDMFHLKVIYDPATETLVYDRKLEPGSGPAIYGLEVCKAMDMDPEFLEEAQEIRRQLMNQSKNLLDTRKSHFNADIFVDVCRVCQAKAEDVHHIKFQCTADDNNMIGNINKDTESNLVPLCKKCHDAVHNGNLRIDGYLQTSEGISLDYKFLEEEKLQEKKQNRKKYDDKQIAIIKGLKNTQSESKIKLSQKYIINKLLTEHQISISSSTLKKIWNNKY